MAQDLNPKPNDTPQPLAVNDPSLTISLAKPTPKRTTTSEQQSTVNQQQDSKGTSKVKVGDHSATITFGSVATPTTPHAATQFGDYEIVGEIARGGMGVVYKARQPRLNRTVAVKMILAGNFASESAVKRFYTEAEAAARLDHSGIVPIYEVGEKNGQHFFSMGFIEGNSLADRVKDGPLPPTDAASIVRKISEAIAYAHNKVVIHRDLKPANVLREYTF